MSFPFCSCGRGNKIAKHTRTFCPRHVGVEHELRDEQGHLPDISTLLRTAGGLQINHLIGDSKRDLNFGGTRKRSMAFPSPSPQHKNDFGTFWRYLRLQ